MEREGSALSDNPDTQQLLYGTRVKRLSERPCPRVDLIFAKKDALFHGLRGEKFEEYRSNLLGI